MKYINLDNRSIRNYGGGVGMPINPEPKESIKKV